MQVTQKLKCALLTSRKILVLCHQNADPDAVCSAFALSDLVRRLNRRASVNIGFPEGASQLSGKLLERLKIKPITRLRPQTYDLIVTVDTSTLDQLGEWKVPLLNSRRTIAVIDHHAPHPETQKFAQLILCDDKASSACELIHNLYRRFKITESKRVAFALLCGLAFETGHFTLSANRSLKMACQLISRGADAEEALAILRMPMNNPERIARLKAAQRIRLERVEGWLVAFSEIGSYHASAARALLNLGAHIAAVGRLKNDEIALTFRSSREFFETTGFHLATDLAMPLGEEMGGTGGGHPTAAAVRVKGDWSETVNRCIHLLRAGLKSNH